MNETGQLSFFFNVEPGDMEYYIDREFDKIHGNWAMVKALEDYLSDLYTKSYADIYRNRILSIVRMLSHKWIIVQGKLECGVCGGLRISLNGIYYTNKVDYKLIYSAFKHADVGFMNSCATNVAYSILDE